MPEDKPGVPPEVPEFLKRWGYMLVLDEKSKTPLHAQLYQQIKTDIVCGRIKAGTKLVSSRRVSAELRISRNTVELAYERLCSEGLVVSKPRRGYFVEILEPETFNKSEAAKDVRAAPVKRPPQNTLYDFRPCNLYLKNTPLAQWKRLMNRCFNEYREGFSRHGAVFGEMGLRAEIQRYIHDYRDVRCTAEQIVVGPGTQFCLGLACALIKSGGLSVAMEEPGYLNSRVTFQNNGFKVCPVRLDEHGLSVKALEETEAAAAYVTPSHQFPVGTVMSAARRTELAEWAGRRDALIIEDDFNCHFQYDVKPVPSLQSLCSDRTIYMGSFSNMLFPCIRISYMVVPGQLLGRLYERAEYDAPFVPFLMQKALELFIREGYWESHVRRVKKHQKEKCEALTNALRHEFGDGIRIIGAHAGLHLLVQVKWPMDEAELIRRASRAGVGVYPTEKYWIHPENSGGGTVLLNFGGMAPENIPAAVRLLRSAWLK